MADKRTVYLFISDSSGMFYRANQLPNGTYSITKNASPYPIKYNPTNLLKSEVEFATNQKYFSLNRSISYPLEFIKDGAAILREGYYLGNGVEEELFLTIVEWNGTRGIHELSYSGRFDFLQKDEDPKSGRFTVPTVDDSAWGILSQNDSVEYSIDCSSKNPKAVKVLFDSITLKNRYTYQTVQAPIIHNTADNSYVIPFVLINQDGDSSGIISKSQSFEPTQNYIVHAQQSRGYFFSSFYDINGVNIQGSISFICTSNTPPAGGVLIFFRTSKGQEVRVFNMAGALGVVTLGKIYNINFNFNLNLVNGENVFLFVQLNDNAARALTLTPIVTDVFVTTLTYAEPTIAYGLRPLDLLQEIVRKATKGRYTMNSEFFTANNKSICLSGDSIRGVENARIYSSFADFFKTFDAINFMALRNIKGSLWMEKATEVYNTNTTTPLLFLLTSTNYFGGSRVNISPIPSYPIVIGDVLNFSAFPQHDFVVSSTGNYATYISVANSVPNFLPLGTFVDSDLSINGVLLGTSTLPTPIIDLGEVNDLQLESAKEFYYNEIEVGSPKQDYRHPSGRLEFNSTNTFSVPLLKVNRKLDIVSKYRLGCYDIQFLILDYRGLSTKDNSGDKSVYVAQITDELGYAIEDVETFVNININNVPLAPIITLPLDNDVINYNKPFVRGVAKPNKTINIYVASILDGSTTSGADGKWSYNINTSLSSYIPGIQTGIHVINSTYTDMYGVLGTISITIDTTVQSAIDITYPQAGDSLYNNKPLIKGIAPNGTNININIDGIVVGSTVSNKSCYWEFKSPVLSNGIHTVTVATSYATFNVSTNIAYPLITYVAGELNGFIIVNNLPLIEGVASPGTVVEIWLNYIQYQYLGTVTADANGNWSYQVVTASYTDPLSGVAVILAPIRNGLNIISTSLVNHTVGINIGGYKLSRPNYSSIEGVIDNTVFNTELSPKRMLLNHAPELSAMLNQQQNESIIFQTADKNSALRTVLGNTVVQENADVPASSLGKPIAVLEYAKIKSKALHTFAKTLYDFNNGGVIKCNFRGTDLYMLPIGSMKMDSIIDSVQQWKLLMSNITTYQQLLNLYKNGLTITLMTNSFYHSDYNSLHFVEYNYQQPDKFNYKTIYQDWFESRNSAWLENPFYIQKYQQTETIKDQIISNGLSNITLRMYRCSDAVLIDTLSYSAVTPAPIPPPDVVLEAIIDFSLYPPDSYFFVQVVSGLEVAISERVETRIKWDKTILIEASNSLNYTGIFFSTGFKTILRVEGLIKKVQPEIVYNTSRDIDGDSELIYSNVSRKREIRFGTAYGLPDYLYLRIANALTTDNADIEGVSYVLADGEKIEPSEDISGHPLYYYNVNMNLKDNSKGIVFNGVAGGGFADRQGVVIVIDATAFGLPVGSLINIKLD